MPIYEYRCRGCGKEFEKYVAAAGTAVACPSCQTSDVTRKLSVFGTAKSERSPVASTVGGGGGCCGGGCACH